jgi:phosphoribosylaminoimidazolecarboxamide formyltransferase / IMP cyclohydrolase
VAKYVKSNAIVFCKDGMTMGVGAGQMSRLDSARIASIKAGHAKLSLQGHGGGQRRFLPVPRRSGRGGGRGRDLRHPARWLDARPGSDRRGDERGVVMVYSGVRHFRH